MQKRNIHFKIIGIIIIFFFVGGFFSTIVADIPFINQSITKKNAMSFTAPNVAWSIEFNDVNGVLVDVQETADGGYIAVGSTTTGFFNSDLADIPYDFQDILLIKVDRDGNRQWMKTFGEPGLRDGGFSVIQTKDGGFAICGRTSTQENTYAWLIKTDKEGNEIWNKKYGGGIIAYSRFDAAYCVRQTFDGGFILAGRAAHYAGYADISDAWLIKTNGYGEEEWNITYNAGIAHKTELAYYVDITQDNGFFVTGYRRNSNPNKGSGWVIKTNQNGTEEWNRTLFKYPSGDGDMLFTGKKTSDGGYITIGYFTDVETHERRFWIIRMNQTGEILWEKTYDTPSDELYSIGYSLDETSDRQFILSGYLEVEYGEFWRPIIWILKIDNRNGRILWDITYDFGRDDDQVTIQTVRCIHQTSDKGFIVAGMRHTMNPWVWYPSLIKIKPELHLNNFEYN